MSKSSSNKIGVGFIGLSATSGWAATALVPALIQPLLRNTYDLVAVSTTSEALAQLSADKYSKEFGHDIKAYFGSASKITSDPDVDLVAVSPAGTWTKDTEEMAELARKQGVRSLVGLQGRHSAVIRKVKEILLSGVIGRVRSTNVIAHLPREAGTFPPFSQEKYVYLREKNSGVTMFTLPIGHQLDTLTYVLGDFVNVTATAATFYPTLTIIDDNRNPTGQTVSSIHPDHYAISGFLESGILADVPCTLQLRERPGAS